MIKRLLLLLIRGYQLLISPMIPPRCRYIPTCSQYAIEALQTHGTVRGSFYTVKRVCRCHPWGGFGYDPVPSKASAYPFYPLSADIALIYTLEYRKKYLKYQLLAEFK